MNATQMLRSFGNMIPVDAAGVVLQRIVDKGAVFAERGERLCPQPSVKISSAPAGRKRPRAVSAPSGRKRCGAAALPQASR